MRVIETFVTSVPREKIPADAKWFMQDVHTENIKFSRFDEKPTISIHHNQWFRGPILGGDDNFGSYPLSTDAAETVVTREELMRAYDLVEQGYTLWFGMPKVKSFSSWAEDFPDVVDVVLDGGVCDSGSPFSFNWAWRSAGKLGVKTSSSIIAWRPHSSEDSNPANAETEIARAGSCTDDDSFGISERYNRGEIECVDIIKEMVADKVGFEAFCVATVTKYLYRYNDKGGIKDVIKARNYLNKMIEEMKNEK